MTVPSSYPGTLASPGFVINAAYSPEPLVLWGRGYRERMGGSPGLLLVPLVSRLSLPWETPYGINRNGLYPVAGLVPPDQG